MGLGQTRGQDPHELRGRRRPRLGPGVRQVVLHGRVRHSEAVGGRLLGIRDEHCRDDTDLAVRGVYLGPRASIPPASRLAAATHSSRPSIGSS